MTRSTQSPVKPQTLAQRASEANRAAQMEDNVRYNRPTPPPRDPEASKRAYEERHKTTFNRR